MRTLTLSGWTQPSNALATALDWPDATTFDYSDYPTPEASFEGLRDFASVERVVAWSMGGQLALRAVAAGVLNPKQLVLIAAPYRFVGQRGMDETTFALFRESYAKDAARTKQRFHGLIAKGDADFKRIVGLLGHHPAAEDTARWLPWLDDLGCASLEGFSLHATPPTLVVHGDGDAIVPYAQAAMLLAALPYATHTHWAETGHAPHVKDAARLRAEIHHHQESLA